MMQPESLTWSRFSGLSEISPVFATKRKQKKDRDPSPYGYVTTVRYIAIVLTLLSEGTRDEPRARFIYW